MAGKQLKFVSSQFLAEQTDSTKRLHENTKGAVVDTHG